MNPFQIFNPASNYRRKNQFEKKWSWISKYKSRCTVTIRTYSAFFRPVSLLGNLHSHRKKPQECFSPHQQSLHHNLIMKLADGPRSSRPRWKTPVFSFLLMKQGKQSLWCRDEECHLSDEGEWLRIKSQIGLQEYSFASASAIAPIVMKVSCYNEAFPCERLWHCGFSTLLIL